MNRKYLTICIVAALASMAGILFAVTRLYSGKAGTSSSGEQVSGHFIDEHTLLKAVPSDAAVVFCFKDFKRACEYLGDTTAAFRKLTADKFDFLADGSYSSLRKSKAILSLHFSRDLPPLLIIGCPSGAIKAAADSACTPDTSADVRRLVAGAAAKGLSCKIDQKLILLSSSETVINSSLRHVSEGHSILESKGFPEVAAKMRDEDAILINNDYSGILADNFLGKKHRKAADFIGEQSDWMGWSISRRGAGGVTMHGEMLYGDDPSYYLNIPESAAAVSTAAEAVPAGAMFVAALPVKNFGRYIKSYRSYLDSKNRLGKYESELERQKENFGGNAEEWAKALDVKEVALAGLVSSDGPQRLLLVRAGKGKADAGGVKPGFVGSLFGGIFTAEEDSCASSGDWLVLGKAAHVREYSERIAAEGSLKDRLGGNGLAERLPQKECGFWAYYCMSADPSIGENFGRKLAEGCRDILRGAQYVPVTLSAVKSDGGLGWTFTLDRTSVTKAKVPGAEIVDGSVIVPEGPFKVRNCGTGKMNTLYQNSHLSICLRDENGKDLWGIPFKDKFCGYVQEVDYFHNSKIQFLFAAGSRLYLIDRLGRFVSGFPVDLGKEVAAGPLVYDFTGAGGYTAMLLFKDNTVGYIDLHGRTVPGWEGINPAGTVRSVPELFEAEGGKYWAVRTSREAMLYPFKGGEPLLRGEGKKLILPDSQFTAEGAGSVKAKCYDGKERTFNITAKEN
ncbi:MAG: hypothetical protein ACI399_07155 [Candidatus Cryptobacteroides sp.]